MSPAPCGCDLRQRAKAQTDARAAEVLDADGARAQKLWRCPRVCEPSDAPLAPACLKAIANAHRVFDVDTEAGDPAEFTTCPCFYARLPAAHQVARLLPWFDKGSLGARVPHPSGALCDAIDITKEALAHREADELRRIRERAESESKSRP